MKVRRFTATTMQKALKSVSEEMGPDAVILSNHRVKGGVEIIVAQNYEPVSAKSLAFATDERDEADYKRSASGHQYVERGSKAPAERHGNKGSQVRSEDDNGHISENVTIPKAKKSKSTKPLGSQKASLRSEDSPPKNPSRTTQKASPKKPLNDDNPWPFLSEDQQYEVREQLKLQDQLEELKQVRQQEFGPVKDSPRIKHDDQSRYISSAQADKVNQLNQLDSQAALKDALQNIKNNRTQSQVPSAHQNNNAQTASYNATDINHLLSEQAPSHPSIQTSPPTIPRQLIDDVKAELHDLKEMLLSGSMGQAAEATGFTWKKHTPQNAVQGKLWQRLEHLGLDEWIIHQLLQGVRSDEDDKKIWQAVLQVLTHHITTWSGDKLQQGGIYALVGPTGAGKTTSIAKMAVRYVMENQEKQVGLVTMDNYRLAAHDQLRTLGQILGVPVSIADQEHNLRQCLHDLNTCDLILIDTAGLTPQHPMLSYQLDQLKQSATQVQTLLTLPATCHSRVLRKVYHNYKAAGLTGCILTKIDEASSLGEAITLLIEAALPLAYCTDGQRIPDDFHVASAKSLVKRSVQIAQQEQMTSSNQTTAASSW